MKKRPSPLKDPTHEALARYYAFTDVEKSTARIAQLAEMNRRRARAAVEARRYQWAGFWRRVAEYQETHLVVVLPPEHQ